MRVKTFCSVMLGLAGLAISAVAMAEEPPAATPPPSGSEAAPAAPAPAPEALPPTTTATAAPGGASESKMRVGLTLVPMPFLGKFKAGGTSVDAAVAFGIMPTFDFAISPNFFVGVGPMYTLNVKGKDASGDAAKELDLMARIGGGAPLTDKIQAYGYVSPGYSIIYPPSGAGGDKPKGFVVGAHAGAMFDIASNVFLNGELGYQLGFQKVSGQDLKTSFFQIGIGGGVRI